MLSVSILGIKENIKQKIIELDNLNIDYFHVDIMDGIFVPNKTMDSECVIEFLNKTKTKKDIHLMVNDINKYIDKFIELEPEFITFHYEATNDHMEIIDYIKSKNIKVGLSIKPNTKIKEIEYLLDKIDLILIMSVEPGFGGQQFIESSIDKINELYNLRKNNNYKFLIEVDGGINNETIEKVKNSDILVVGSYITNSNNYKEKIDTIKK